MWRPTLTLLSFLLSFASDYLVSNRSVSIIVPGYGALVLHGMSTYALEHLRGVLAPTVNPTLTTAASTLGAALIGLPLYAFRQAIVCTSHLGLSLQHHSAVLYRWIFRQHLSFL